MFQKKYLGRILLLSLILYTPFIFSKENKNVVVIKNEASSATQIQAITAPSLVPSPAKKFRSAREKQEIETEDKILKELEKQRLLDEQKRVDQLFGKQQNPPTTTSTNTSPAASTQNQWFFGNRSFGSLGVGIVSFPGVRNVNSTKTPAGFFSFGGYGYKGNLIFDFSIYYSKHYMKTPHKNYTNVRSVYHQPAVSMSIKISPLKGKVKPYVGGSGSLVYRRRFFVDRLGKSLNYNEAAYKALKDVAEKTWHQSFDAGVALGSDVALGEDFGFNVDIRYHVNLYTENRSRNAHEFILDKRDSVIASASLRYYF